MTGRAVFSLAVVAPDRIAVGHFPVPTIVIYNTAAEAMGTVAATLVGHEDGVYALVLLPKGRLASGGYEGSVRVWDLTTGECEHTLLGHTQIVTSLALLLGGQLASCRFDRSVRVWDLTTGACTAVLAHESAVYSLAALPLGGVAAGCHDGAIALWGGGGAREGTLGDGAGFGLVASLSLLPDSRLAAGYGYGDHSVRVWDVQRRQCDAVLKGHTDIVLSLAVLPDGRLLSGSADRIIRVWDEGALSVRGGGTGKSATVLEGHTGSVNTLAVLPNGSVASGGGGYQDGTVRFWV